MVEAAERSGALITANFAKELGREVLVPPHEIYSSTGKGTNELIGHGASIYLHPSQLMFKNESILVEDKVSVESDQAQNKKVDYGLLKNKKELLPIEEKIISCIMGTAKTLEEIGNEIQINHVELIGYISIMELEDKLRVIAGGRYVASASYTTYYKYSAPGYNYDEFPTIDSYREYLKDKVNIKTD